MSASSVEEPVARLIEQALADPSGYRQRVDELLDRYTDDALARVHVRWAAGLALRELGELAAARDELLAAANDAVAVDARGLAATIRSSRAVVLLHLGDTGPALAETDAAAAALDGVGAARNEMQRGLILQRLGRQDEAIVAYDRAQPQLRVAGDRAAESRLLSNRGVLHAYRGALDAARADLERSVELARGLGAVRPIALGLQNLGFVAGRQGRLPDALALLEEADGLLRELDAEAALAVLDTDRAEVLAEAGLLDEAIERAEAAASTLATDRMNGAEAELLVARLCLLAGHRDRAARLAGGVLERFRDGGRDGWVLHARYVALAAQPEAVDADLAVRLADDLESGGWATEARAARSFAARQAIAEGRHDVARRALEALRGVSRRAPALARAQHWYATALLRLDAGDRRGARRAVTAGADVLDRSRLVFASAELRAHAAAHAIDLSVLGVRMALEDRRPAEALRTLDRVRATDVAVPPPPPQDPKLAADLAELRRLDEVERDAARAGQDVTGLVVARAEVEERIRARTRTVAHAAAGSGDLRLDIAALRRALAGRTLAAYLHLDGRLQMLTVTPRATRHHDLGPVADVRADLAHLRAAVRRLAHGNGSPASLAAAEASLARSTEVLTRRLGLDQVEREGLVVVPTAPLDGLPWGVFTTAAGHVPTLAPSAAAWLAAATRERSPGTTLLAAGPDLPGAAREVAELAALRSDARVLRGDDATVAAVLAAMQRSSTAHLAAHGSFRADNPLFSSLRLADGALTAYDLEALTRLPELLILPSCEAAAATTLRGDAVLGLSSVLLRLGVRNVVAPVVEIPDDATTPLMLDLHRRLLGGAPPQRALGEAIAAAADDGPAAAAVRAAFVIVGGAAG